MLPRSNIKRSSIRLGPLGSVPTSVFINFVAFTILFTAIVVIQIVYSPAPKNVTAKEQPVVLEQVQPLTEVAKVEETAPVENIGAPMQNEGTVAETTEIIVAQPELPKVVKKISTKQKNLAFRYPKTKTNEILNPRNDFIRFEKRR